ncbi:MAG: bifunctional N(6)-L-threonylcarbamoyladenine synthase/serine/threonine protein kinase [Candidatus Aenigmarchaeota archaeon]|nr:bifunctional N(6)-L-threonylcarbamoyladenine synthase/serine/threonine protein kinase [Candidatus Aenigmarchaeota archaeon]
MKSNELVCLGIEGTAHTFGIGIVKDKEILSNAKDVYKPKHGSGIHPGEAAAHHKEVGEKVLEEALAAAGVSLSDLDILSYSAGPGLPPCLKATAEFVQELAEKTNKPPIPVNHCIAHIEIGRMLTKSKDPVIIYVSGGNTQIIGYASQRYRVFGETMDIAIGNALDTFIRETTGDYPGGPILENLAKAGKNYVELPYVVKGMDLSFSGIITAALNKYKQKEKLRITLEDICFSLQETTFAMLTEVTERALAHTGKSEVLLTGGVAANKRLTGMLDIMCKERGASFYVCPMEYAGDCGANIAWAGLLQYLADKNDEKPVEKADFKRNWRTDDVEVNWI